MQVALGVAFAVVAATGGLDFISGDDDASPQAREPARPAARRADLFDSAYAWGWLERQVELGPRPAGSSASRRLAGLLRDELPGGRYQRVPGGLRNVIATVPGRTRGRLVVVGAHYDTKDIPDFVGANDGAGGTAAVLALARGLKPRTIGPTVVFALFDGEESPRGTPDSRFEREGLRGSRVAARRYRDADAMVLLDFVADRDLSIPREQNSDPLLWAKLRQSAAAAGVIRHFPRRVAGGVSDDHIPFIDEGVPSLDLIDFSFPCWHRTCDDLSAVSERSLDASGEAVARLLRRL